jgi:hypothetical protein
MKVAPRPFQNVGPEDCTNDATQLEVARNQAAVWRHNYSAQPEARLTLRNRERKNAQETLFDLYQLLLATENHRVANIGE